MPSTSRCLHSSEQAARTSQLPPFFPSFPLVHLPSRSTLDRRLKTPRSPGEEASIFASCPRQLRQQKHRHREDAARVENGIARAFGESRRVPPTFRKTRRFFKFTAANQTTPRRPPFQETSRCCFAGHLRSFVLFFVVRHPRALSSGRQPHFVFLSLSHALHFLCDALRRGTRVALSRVLKEHSREPPPQACRVIGALFRIAPPHSEAPHSAARSVRNPIPLGGTFAFSSLAAAIAVAAGPSRKVTK